MPLRMLSWNSTSRGKYSNASWPASSRPVSSGSRLAARAPPRRAAAPIGRPQGRRRPAERRARRARRDAASALRDDQRAPPVEHQEERGEREGRQHQGQPPALGNVAQLDVVAAAADLDTDEARREHHRGPRLAIDRRLPVRVIGHLEEEVRVAIHLDTGAIDLAFTRLGHDGSEPGGSLDGGQWRGHRVEQIETLSGGTVAEQAQMLPLATQSLVNQVWLTS